MYRCEGWRAAAGFIPDNRFYSEYAGCRTFRPLNAGYPLRLDGLLLVCGYVGVGFLFHARSAFFAVGMRREHFLYRRGLRSLGKLDQLVQRIAHAVGAETVLYGEFESVFVGFVFLLLRELGAGEGRHDLAELRVAQLGQRAALGRAPAALRVADER